MTLNYEETKSLIDGVLAVGRDDARKVLQVELKRMDRTMQEFYEGVIQHGPHLTSYTSDQWLDFHLKIPHWRLQREKALMDKLSPKQRELL